MEKNCIQLKFFISVHISLKNYIYYDNLINKENGKKAGEWGGWALNFVKFSFENYIKHLLKKNDIF